MEIMEYLIKSSNYKIFIKRFFLLSLFLSVFIRYNKSELFVESNQNCEKNQCTLMETEESER